MLICWQQVVFQVAIQRVHLSWFHASRALSHAVHGHQLHSELSAEDGLRGLSAQDLVLDWHGSHENVLRVRHDLVRR